MIQDIWKLELEVSLRDWCELLGEGCLKDQIKIMLTNLILQDATKVTESKKYILNEIILIIQYKPLFSNII